MYQGDSSSDTPQKGMMRMRDTIDSIIQERRKTEKESRQLQDQINRLEAEKLEKDDSDNLEALNRQIEELSLDKRAKAEKLKNLCRIAQMISAGD